MVQILPERAPKRPSVGQQLLGGALSGGADYLQSVVNKRDQAAANEAQMTNQMKLKQFESELAGQRQAEKYSFEQEIEGLKTAQKAQEAAEKLRGEQKEKIAPYITALETVKRMRQLGAKGNLGIGSQFTRFLDNDTAKQYGEYEQLGKSLIQMASPIVIRNKAEFEVLSHNLFDPSLMDAQREGILDSMEKIISDNLRAYETGELQMSNNGPMSVGNKSNSDSIGSKPQPKRQLGEFFK